MGSSLPLKLQADLKSNTACSYSSFAPRHHNRGLWRSNMAEAGVEEESTAPEAPSTKFWSTRQGWIKDNNRTLPVIDSRGEDLSYKTHDFRCTQTPLLKSPSSSATWGWPGSWSSSSTKYKARSQHRFHTPILESSKHHGSALEQQGVGITTQSRTVFGSSDLSLLGRDET